MLPWNNTLQQCHRTVCDSGKTTVRMPSSGICLERLSQGTHAVGDMAYKEDAQRALSASRVESKSVDCS